MTFYYFLTKIRPLVNASGLAQAAGLPRNTLGKHYRFADGKPHGQACDPKHFPAIVRALCDVFGVIEIGGWRIVSAPMDPAIITIRAIPGREPECIEVDGHFEYLQPEYRNLYDDNDFAHYFGA